MVFVGVHCSKPIFPFVSLFSALESAPGAAGFVGLKCRSIWK